MRCPRILLAAPASGSGKTMVTCGILQALVDRGFGIASFKCGPDYIDPMFHSRVIGTSSRNLDTFFTQPEITRYLFGRAAAGQELSVVEGVMGYYDGLGGISLEGSSFDVARTLDLPVVLIVNCRGQSLSVLPVIKGFLEYQKDSRIRGVIFNQMSAGMYPDLERITREELSLEVLGYVPPVPELTLESRHLGLVLPHEVEKLQGKLKSFARVLEKTVDLDRLIRMARGAGELAAKRPDFLDEMFAEAGKSPDSRERKPLRIALARDAAFCFTYADNLELLEEWGADLVEFSPLEDEKLPAGCQGMILSGGYPELYAKKLSANSSMLESIRHAIEQGMPCIAECGGFLYLHQQLEGQDGIFYPMAGVIPGRAYRTERLGRFGYITLTARQDQLLLQEGEEVRGHEFHYWESECCGESLLARKPLRSRSWLCGHGSSSLYAGFPHLFYYSNPKTAINFLKRCEEFPC